jgi:CheY-like chemotaxis protein
LLGGDIGVITAPGEGSEFWFTLPLDEAVTVRKKVDHPGRIVNSDWKGRAILIAEDDDLNFRLVSEALRRTNIEIIRAKDGNETIALFNEHSNRIDMVLMDIRMPEIDGYECTRIIKEKVPGMPVIAQTAYAMSGERLQSMHAGCDDYISKPMNMADLIGKMSRFIK